MMEIDVKYNYLFWDFNGTVFNDVDAGIRAVNKMLAERGLEVIGSVEKYREIFDFPVIDYYRALGFDFDKEPYYEVLAPMWVDLYNEYSRESVLCDGVSTTLAAVRELGVKQILFSATEINMLMGQLCSLSIADRFDEVIGIDNIHAGGKLHLAKKWREEHPDAKILYVGDTVHDAENARVLGADCLLYLGGHQSRERLAGCGCSLIESITEILDHIK
jgi:phosphoglycolate phosphatase